MKVLWFCNFILPGVAKALSVEAPSGGGWVSGAAQALMQNEGVELSVCFPQSFSGELLTGMVGKLRYYGFPCAPKAAHIYDVSTQKWQEKILATEKPDIVHIWGAEFASSLAMVNAFRCPAKTIINIQGLCGYIAKHSSAHLPYRDCVRYTLRDFLRKDRIIDQQKNFGLRGKLEAEALGKVGHVIGRTRWDQACVRQLAPKARYHKCNETLRRSFYENAGSWSPDSCEKHSIFVSQASCSLKGFHMVLEAMPEILKRYPDAKLYTTGKDPFMVPFYRVSGYQRLLKRKICKLGLQGRVFFVGDLKEEDMCQRFLKANVFVSASSIENSPNSVGEAMMLGVPTVASFVGGTMDLLCDGEEGFLYQSDAPYMLADHVCSVFGDDENALKMGKNASRHALQTHDVQENLNTLLKIYCEVSQN